MASAARRSTTPLHAGDLQQLRVTARVRRRKRADGASERTECASPPVRIDGAPLFRGVSRRLGAAKPLRRFLHSTVWMMRSSPFRLGALGFLVAACAPQGLPPPAHHPSAAEQ